MNFATLKGLSIPQGNVKQITKDGVLLWSGDDGMRNITIIPQVSMAAYGSVTIDGTVYKPSFVAKTTELVLPVDTNIKCHVRTYSVSASAESGAIGKIVVNGNVVAQTNDTIDYNYTVTKNASITIETLSTNGTLGGYYGLITITES